MFCSQEEWVKPSLAQESRVQRGGSILKINLQVVYS